MFELAITTAHRDAIRKAHSERAKTFSELLGWPKILAARLLRIIVARKGLASGT
ncbi:MAG: hypothetical protein AAF982_13030 [Pseudomonadota bacterium]